MKKVKYFIFLFFSILLSLSLNGQNNWEQKVNRLLLEEAKQGKQVDFLIVLKEQADLSLARQLHSKEEKGRYVYEQLHRLADKTQYALRRILSKSQQDYRAFFLVNALQVSKADLSLMEKIARRPEVQEIQADPWTNFPDPNQEETNLNFRSDLTWGLNMINAPAAWDLGAKGQGVTVGGQDTGYEWDHPALVEAYRGWQKGVVDHNYNWHDAIREINPMHNDTNLDASNNPCGLNSDTPCDDNNHGTHTMGTMIGNDESGVQIGVAPAARWIGCRNMERGYGRPSTYIECFEWFLAPTNTENNEADPGMAPHVINNSWACPEVEGCNTANWATMERAVENLRTAGIVIVVSTGNSGRRGCGSVGEPPAIFEGSFSVGASNSNDKLAGLSSRGPVYVDGSGRLKPNVVAPGIGVRSSFRNGRYGNSSGTSMAGPHVAGLVALLISANPQLAGQVELIESIIEQTAVPIETNASCGGQSNAKVPNPVFGYGRIDALAAVKKAQEIFIAPNFPIQNPGLRIFPNPAQSEATFQLDDWTGSLQLRLVDAMGRKVKQVNWSEADGLRKQIDLHQLDPGFYFYHLTGESNHWSGRLVKR